MWAKTGYLADSVIGMAAIAGLAMVVAAVIISHSYRQHRRVMPHSIGLSLLMAGLAVSGYLYLGDLHTWQARNTTDVPQTPITVSDWNQQQISQIQDQLRADKQNGELWFALGNAYMADNRFGDAVTAFGYAQRLAGTPQANLYSALASADYYQHQQRFTERGRMWLDQALRLEPDNLSALLLLASDYFLEARYQKAIDTWQLALDTEHRDLDRASIIQSIHRAQSLLSNS